MVPDVIFKRLNTLTSSVVVNSKLCPFERSRSTTPEEEVTDIDFSVYASNLD